MPTRRNRWFLLQILLLAQHISGTTMPIIRSSRVLCTYRNNTLCHLSCSLAQQLYNIDSLYLYPSIRSVSPALLRDIIKGTFVLGQYGGCKFIVKQNGTWYVDCGTHLIATHTHTHILVNFLLKTIEWQNLGMTCDTCTRLILPASVIHKDKRSVQLITFSRLCAHCCVSVWTLLNYNKLHFITCLGVPVDTPHPQQRIYVGMSTC